MGFLRVHFWNRWYPSLQENMPQNCQQVQLTVSVLSFSQMSVAMTGSLLSPAFIVHEQSTETLPVWTVCFGVCWFCFELVLQSHMRQSFSSQQKLLSLLDVDLLLTAFVYFSLPEQINGKIAQPSLQVKLLLQQGYKVALFTILIIMELSNWVARL